MSSSQGASHNLKLQARVIAPHLAESNKSRWWTGTNALRDENEVTLLEYDPEREVLKSTASYVHSSEVWCIAASPSDASKLATVHNEGGTYGAAVWSAPSEGGALQLEGRLEGHEGVVRAVRWDGLEHSRLASIEDGFLRLWQCDGSIQEAGTIPAGNSYTFWTGAWDSKSSARFCTSGGGSIQVWDFRAMKQAAECEGAHVSPIRDLDFAHQGEHLLASAGDDCRVKVWDLRFFSKPLSDVVSHSHWVWQVRFNPFHDQLLLSSSSDATVKLLHLPSLGSSQASLSQQRGHAPKDAPVASYDIHEDSVYGIAWSALDPWIFASISYDGRIAVSQVPSNVKYKILI